MRTTNNSVTLKMRGGVVQDGQKRNQYEIAGNEEKGERRRWRRNW
jgi:hypothetical protein